MKPTASGSRYTSTAIAVTMPAEITAICHLCVRATASLPPVTVYTITSAPVKRMTRSSRQPRTVEMMIAGA